MSKGFKGMKLSPSHQLLKKAGGVEYSPSHAMLAEQKEEKPTLDPVKPMPIGDSEDVRRARRKSLASQQRRSGRAATVLSQGESLG